jgi:hypothetical protein
LSRIKNKECVSQLWWINITTHQSNMLST